MPEGSTKKICPFCQGILFCAQKICSHCKKEQPLKQRLKKKLQRFDEKREEWVVGRKKNHNTASIKDEANIMDYLQKIGSFYEYLCEGWTQDSSGNEDQLITLQLTPCQASPTGGKVEQAESTEGQVEQAESTGGQVEQAESTEGQVEQAESTEGQVEQAESTEGQVEQAESTGGQVEQAESTEGQVEQAESTGGQVEQAESTEGQVEQAESTEGQVEQAESTDGQVEQAESTEGQVEQAESTEGQVEQAESTEGQVEQAESTDGQVEQAESTGGQVEQAESTEGQVEQAESTGGQVEQPESTGGGQVEQAESTEGQVEQPESTEGQDCSYHTRLEAFPIRSVGRERVRKATEDAENETPNTVIMGIYKIRRGDCTEDIGVVIEGIKVLSNLACVILAFIMLFGIIYSHDLSFPDNLKYTFEFIQKIIMNLDGHRLIAKIQQLKIKLFA
ncbi:unnamed protein product [Leuciscus chuanchicus]